MTHKEIKDNLILVLQEHSNHTIVRHINAAGKLCYRVRDNKVNPIANMPDSIFSELSAEQLII